MSGISLSAKEPAIADRVLLADEVTVYHGQPTQLSRFVRVVINGVIGRLYFEELTPAEDQAYMVRHYDFVAQHQAATAAMAKADEAKKRAKAANQIAQQMTQHNMALLAQLSQESDRRSALLQEKAALQDKLNAAVVECAETMAKMHNAKQAVMEECASLRDACAQQMAANVALGEQLAQTRDLQLKCDVLQATVAECAVDKQNAIDRANELAAQLAAAPVAISEQTIKADE